MSDIWAMIPVKALARAKTRLAAVLQPDECARLSRAMFMDVLSAIQEADGINHIAVLTNDTEVAELAGQLGHTVIADNTDGDLCDNLDSAARLIAARGGDTVLVIPGDIPTVTAADVETLLQKHSGGLSICPAIRDGGTNALLCSPPDAIPFQFGTDSARRHAEEAARRGVPVARISIHAFFRDIDTPDDLLWLTSQTGGSHTVRYLQQSGITARLGPGYLGALP